MTNEDTLVDLVTIATHRAYEKLLVTTGREPTRTEVEVYLLQAQVSLLLAATLEDEDLLEFWREVAAVVQGDKANGSA